MIIPFGPMSHDEFIDLLEPIHKHQSDKATPKAPKND